jgi:tetratricopeptide (TPR) repeat protein
MTRRINGKFLAHLVVGLVVLGVAIHLLHEFQVRREAGAWLRLARRAQEQGELSQCLNHLGRYLRYQPQDVDVLADYALLLRPRSTTVRQRVRVFNMFERVLLQLPDRQDVRRQLADVALELGRFADAQHHLKILLAQAPDDGQLEHFLGWCQENQGEAAQAAAWYEKAVRHAPSQLASSLRLAHVLENSLDQPDEAQSALDRMVAANPKSIQAHLARGRHAQRRGAWEQTAADLRAALELSPGDPDILVVAAELAPRTGRLDQTRTELARGLEAHPHDARLYFALVDLELQSRRPEEAIRWLRRGVRALPDQADLQHLLCDLLLERGLAAEARTVISGLTRAGWPPARFGYWEARLRMHEQLWAEGARLLEGAAVDPTAAPWAQAIDLALGACYEQLDEQDRQLIAFRRAVGRDPASAVARLGLGRALLAIDRAGEAVSELRQVVRLPRPATGAWSALARALLVHNRQLAPAQRDWSELEQALDRASREQEGVIPLLLLRAELLAAREDYAEARRLLERVRDEHPGVVEVWRALADLADRQDKPAAALAILDEAQRRLGNRLEWRLARLQSWARRGGAEARRHLAALEPGLETFPAAQQRRFRHELAAAYFRVGALAEAERQYRRLAEAQPDDLRSRLLLIDLYLQAGAGEPLRDVLEQVRQIEGAGGTQWRCGEASRLILQAHLGDKSGLGQARRLLAELARERPEWARVPLLEARVAELDSRSDQAISAYQRAMELGVREPAIAQRLVQRLLERRRFAEADFVVRQFEEQGLRRTGLTRLAAEVALGVNQPERARQLAHQAVTVPARDYRDTLWLSRIVEAAGQAAEAEDLLRGAIRRAGDIPDTWVALVKYQAQHGQTAAAAETLQEVRRRLPTDRVALALAACYEALGQNSLAEGQYQAALHAIPDEFIVLHQAAAFFLRAGQPAKAQPHLRALARPANAAPAEQVAWARRQLALIVAEPGSPANVREALALIEQNCAACGETVEDRRARARVLATQPEGRPLALRLLEESREQQPFAPEEQFLLAQLYEAAGDTEQAREQLLGLVVTQERQPLYLASYIWALLRWGDEEEAQRWFVRLEQLEPQTPRTAALRQEIRKAHN